MPPRSRVALLLLATLGLVSGSSMPIWEMLSYEEKMGRVLFVLMQLVGDYCSSSSIQDCRKVMMLYGTSSLMNQSQKHLDTLDVYEKNALNTIWQSAFKSTFKFPTSLNKPGNQALTSISYGLDEFDEDVDRPQLPTKFITEKPPTRGRS